tara:strand:+ start:611 stop:916 length:306 start_codon:yes stop_codon:yes gene_type:complete
MEYLKVFWNHIFEDEPVLFYFEITEKRYETRRVEIFLDGSNGYASDKISSGKTEISYVKFDSVRVISESSECDAEYISQEEFEKLWNKSIHYHIHRNPQIV